MRSHPWFSLALLLATLVLPPGAATARAEAQRFGAYDVNYSVVPTAFLRADVAERYGIERVRGRAMISVTVKRREGNGTKVVIPATIVAEEGDLLNKRGIILREVRDGSAIDYIGVFPFANGKLHYFSLKVMPEGDTGGFTATFMQELYDPQ